MNAHALATARAVWAAAIERAGDMVLVPKEPTHAMLIEAENIDWADSDVRGNLHNMWNVMLAAAPVADAPPADTRAKALEEADKRFIRQLPDGLVMASADLLKEIRYRMEHKEDCGPQRLPDGDCYCGHISLAKAIDAAITGKP